MLKTHLDFLKNINKNFTTLFVEDNKEIRNQTILTLQRVLPVIISAEDGEEGLELFKKHKYSSELKDIDLIISDIEMPKKDGLEMLTEIKKLNPSIPIIITSAYTNTEYFLDAINIGIDSYILKPYTLDSMIEILYDTLQKRNIVNASNKRDSQLIPIGSDYSYDLFNKLLLNKNKPIKLSKNEIILLEVLIEANGQNVPYKTIEYSIWQDLPMQNHSLRSLIYRLRSKTFDDIIQTVPSFGYKLPHYTAQ